MADAARKHRPEPRFDRQEILDKIREWNARYGVPPTTKDWEPCRALASGQDWRATRYAEGEWPSLSMVRRSFGTFNAAIVEAGFEPRPARSPNSALDAAPDRILRAIVEWTRRYGAPPSQTDWDPCRARKAGQPWRAARFHEGDWPRLKTVRRHFGSLNNAVEAVGLCPRRPGEHGRAELHHRSQNLHNLAASIGHHRTVIPLSTDLGAAVRAVVSARRARDSDQERQALLDLAGAALRLADDVAWGANAA